MKKRWKVGKDGKAILPVCPHCGCIHCDLMHSFSNTISMRKTQYRLSNKLCIGCGRNPCKCKNKGR